MKYIFVTGGVVEFSLAKVSLRPRSAPLLELRGLRVVFQKFDPYLNVDPGTMSPFQARRSLCVERRGGDGPRPRALRTVH